MSLRIFRLKKWVLLGVFCALTSSLLCANQSPYFSQPSKASTAPFRVHSYREHVTVSVGSPFWIALRLSMNSNWYLQWKPEEIERKMLLWRLPPELKISKVLWPAPRILTYAGRSIAGYPREVIILVELKWREGSDKSDYSRGSTYMEATLEGEVEVCSNLSCLFEQIHHRVTLPRKRYSNEVPPTQDPLTLTLFQQARARLPSDIPPFKIRHEYLDDLFKFEISKVDMSIVGDWYLVPINRPSYSPYDNVIKLRQEAQTGKDTFYFPSELAKKLHIDQGMRAFLTNEHSGQSFYVEFSQGAVMDEKPDLWKQVADWWGNFKSSELLGKR